MNQLKHIPNMDKWFKTIMLKNNLINLFDQKIYNINIVYKLNIV